MGRVVVSYVFILLAFSALWASTSRPAMQYLSSLRDNDSWWGTYQGRHGDLVSMSYLDFVHRFNPGREERILKRANAGGGHVALYLHGDSYTRHLGDSVFYGVAGYYYIDRNHPAWYHLDTAYTNVLLLEVSERYLQSYYGDLRLLHEFTDTFAHKSVGRVSLPSAPDRVALAGIGIDDLFNKYINQNLQFNLFNYNWSMPLFQGKAALNYYIFNRASGDVVIAKDRQSLFLKQTVTATDEGSSYRPVSDSDIARLAANFNAIYDHFRACGFSGVYLSVIPNAASTCQPEGYSGLIPRLQHAPGLRMPVIDAYTALAHSPVRPYMTGDTHWNTVGLQLWLDIVNEKLEKIK